MIYKPRLLGPKLRRMLERFPVVVVSGARQVGKSTLLAHELPQWESVVFDPVVDVGNARQDPDLFLDNHTPPLVLDEIQYAPELVPAIKRRVDRGPGKGQYVLTGSQQWSVLKSASESLAGRAVFLDLEGFSLHEILESATENHWLKRYLNDPRAFLSSPSARMPSSRTLYQQLWRGFLPAADSLEEEWVGEFCRSYLRTYIERDVRLLSDVSDWQQFGRFVRLATALTAKEINASQLGRELGITPQTAQRWLAMLRGTFQWFEVPAFHGNTIKRISSKPKGYFAETALACNLQTISSPQGLSGHPLLGAVFETGVVGEIRKLSATLPLPPAFHHWRAQGGAEVDLVLELDGRLYPIEVKLSSHPTQEDAGGIEAFRQAYPKRDIAPGLVIAPVERKLRLTKNDCCLPWDCR